MHAEHQTEGELLAELRQLHRSERAPAELRERIVERLRRRPDPAPRVSPPSRRPWLALAAVTLIAVAFGMQQGLKRAEPARFGTVAAEPHRVPRVVTAPTSRTAHCPLDDLQPGAVYEPERLAFFNSLAGTSHIELGTFAMPIPGCGSLVRRYLLRMPRAAAVPSSAPVLIVLHESGDSAEYIRGFPTQQTFETLADREGLIILYANAGPGARTGRLRNSGGWQTDPGANRALDDEAYLAALVEQLAKRGTITGGNAVFLVGYGGGGTLALETAAQHSERYTGVAALLPAAVNQTRADEHAKGSRLSRVLFIVAASDRPNGYWPERPLDVAVLEEWAVCIGLPRFLVSQGAGLGPSVVDPPSLQRRVYPLDGTAEPEIPDLPSGSKHFDFDALQSGSARLRVLVLPRGSALQAGPNHATPPLDAASLVWSFLREAVH
jgi:pimeloyl-ACP methyl ester carboxylesterase